MEERAGDVPPARACFRDSIAIRIENLGERGVRLQEDGGIVELMAEQPLAGILADAGPWTRCKWPA